MKNIFIALIIGLLFFASCSEPVPVEEDCQEDYRKKWVGVYLCQKETDRVNDSAKTVFLDVMMLKEDSLLYIREETDYPMEPGYFLDVKVKAEPYGDLWYISGISGFI